jgi:exodeoxyribonuclease VII, small subunit
MSKTTNPTPASQQASYEQLYAQLQQVVEQLEQGELALDEALKLYEQGTALAAACQQLLDQAELRIQTLQESDQQSWSLSSDE